MAYQTQPIDWYPKVEINPANSNVTIDATGEKCGQRFPAPKTGNIRKIHFRIGGVTSAQSLTNSMQNEDLTTGFPDGTADQTAAAIAVPVANTWHVSDFTGVERAVTIGDIVWHVIEYTSTAGNLNIVAGAYILESDIRCALFTSSWQAATRSILAFVEYDDGACYPIIGCGTGIVGTQTWNNSAGNQERGLKIRWPYPKQIGAMGWQTNSALVGDATITLYDSDTTSVLAQKSIDKDSLVVNSTGLYFAQARFTPVSVAANTYVYVVLKPDSASNITLRYNDVDAEAWLDQLIGGQDAHYVERATAGSGGFTATTTRRPQVFVGITAFDDGASAGGGLLRHPGMAGGCNA